MPKAFPIHDRGHRRGLPERHTATAALGVAALIHPVPNSGLEAQAWLAALIRALLAGTATVIRRIGRVGGLILIGVYGGFLAFRFTGHSPATRPADAQLHRPSPAT